jgi:sugar O-acyltransferase (sialic acid O-acetyltransferase NeuD family)
MNVIFGASGCAKDVLFLIERINELEENIREIDYFVAADGDPLVGSVIKKTPVVSSSYFLEKFSKKSINCFIAVGSPSLKQKIVLNLREEINPVFPSLIDPSVIFGKAPGSVTFGEGVVVCAGSILTTDIKISSFVHINLDCTVTHDCSIGEYSTLSPGVHISGNVKMGSKVFIGTGAVVLEKIEIIENSVVGAGAVVTSNINDPGVYVGMPAKKRG